MQQRVSNFLKPAALLLMLLVLLLVTPSVDALFGKLTKKKKEQEEKAAAFTGTESAGMGLDAFQDLCKYRDWMIFVWVLLLLKRTALPPPPLCHGVHDAESPSHHAHHHQQFVHNHTILFMHLLCALHSLLPHPSPALPHFPSPTYTRNTRPNTHQPTNPPCKGSWTTHLFSSPSSTH